MKMLQCILCLGLWTTVNAASPKKVYIFAGQSNMVGMRSEINKLPSGMRDPLKQVVFYKNGEWVPLVPGVTEPEGFGPEISFAYTIAPSIPSGETIGIIKLSKGGSLLATHWNPRTADTNNYYPRLLRLVAEAKQTGNFSIAGFLWMQGESDCVNTNRADRYAANLSLLIKSLRAEFESPEMPFICARVNPPIDKFPMVATVRKAQEECTESGYIMINCDDLTKGSDGLHYDTAGIVELGKRFAIATFRGDLH